MFFSTLQVIKTAIRDVCSLPLLRRTGFGIYLISIVAATLAVGALAQTLQNIQTSFEFTDTDGRFTIGTCPGCAVFENGQAKTVGIPGLYIDGTRAWLIPPGATARVTFETPADEVRLFIKDQDASVNSVLTLLDENNQILMTVNGSPDGPQVMGFTEVEISGSAVKTITFQNNSQATGSQPYAVMENFEASFVEGSQQVTVDTFFFPRFGDGIFEAAGETNTFTTEGIFVNTGNFATVKLDIFSDNGETASIVLEDQQTGNRVGDSTFTFGLASGEAKSMASVGMGADSSRSLVVGYWRVRVQRSSAGSVTAQQSGDEGAGVGGTAVFARSQEADQQDVLLFETGVAATRTQRRFSIFMDSTAQRDTGLALLNPPAAEDASPAQTRDANVTIEVWDVRFENRLAVAPFVLPIGNVMSKFIWEYVRDFGGASQAVIDDLQERQAVVTVVSDTDIVPLTLRQNNPNAVFPEAVPTLTAFPVISAGN